MTNVPPTEASNTPANAHNEGSILEELTTLHYKRAKTWTGWHLGMEAVIYLSGVAVVFFPKLPVEYPAVALVLVLITAMVSAKAEKFKGVAETLKRRHEYWQGFGVAPSRDQLADLRLGAGRNLPPALEKLLREGLTFSSDKPSGAERVLENLSESSWFSKHLANWCSDRLGELFIAAIGLAVIVLLTVASSAGTGHAGSGVAKCVSSSLAFLMSVGVLRSCLDFSRFSREAGDIEAEAQRLLRGASKLSGCFPSTN